MTDAEYREALVDLQVRQLAAYEAWNRISVRATAYEIAARMTSAYKSPSTAQRNALVANAEWVREQLLAGVEDG